MAKSPNGHLRDLHAGIGAVAFLVTAAYLHLQATRVPTWSVSSMLFLASGAMLAAAIVGELGAKLQYAVAVCLARSGVCPRTGNAPAYARLIAFGLTLADLAMGVLFTWITFGTVYWSALR